MRRAEGSGFARLARRLVALLLPQDCLVCGAPIRAGTGRDWPVCTACAAALPRLSPERCPVCALPTPDGLACGHCQSRPPAFDATLAPFVYGFPMDRLIQALKYRHRLALSAWFGYQMVEELEKAQAAHSLDIPADVILPMPLHPRRLADRGFNQALELARPLAHLTGLPLSRDGVERTLNAPPQASLPWQARRKNIRGAFLCREDFSGRHVLVVDDVMTTGSTLEELAGCLKGRGATRVTNLVLARALPQGMA
ncbi:MAG: ComF family protein [Rhodocyclaceae bacterium]|nr:ComF family protein [Rhodocyclaceae bacterium]